jgi:1-acyl-sn-glycerol-3-phosphate acyltransferase
MAKRQRNTFYNFIVRLAKTVIALLRWRVEIRGAEHVPASGPAILAANHVSFLDFIFIGYGADRQRRLVRFLSRHEAFSHPVSGPLMKGMRHIPVNRDADPSEAFRHAIDALKQGEVIGLHPEGKMNPVFDPEKMKTGAARMAMDTGAPLIPVAVWGGQRIWTKGYRKLFQLRARIQVAYGEPLRARVGESARDLTDRLAGAIRDMLPPEAEVARAA